MNVDIEALKQGAESLIKKKPSVTGAVQKLGNCM